ncbi:MAG: hypothetical protein RJA22_2841 [Verrucomicrobiota bacterium]|jgi:HAE1 family hydrophobic/amphiphilic exporter-1
MRSKALLLLAVVCSFLPAAAQVQPAPRTAITNQLPLFGTQRIPRQLSLDACIQMALEHNLRIQVVRYDPVIQRYQLAASYGLYDPAFGISYNKFENTTEGRFNPNTGIVSDPSSSTADSVSPGLTGTLPSGMTYELGGNFTYTRGDRDQGQSFENYVADVSIQLEQPLLRDFWTDANRTTIQINKRSLAISELALEQEIRLVTRDVQSAYYELMFALDDVKVQEKALELAKALVSENTEKVKQGVMAPLDARQAESQAATALADYIQAQGRAYVAESLLKNLVTDEYQKWLDVAVVPADRLVALPQQLNTTESWASALAQRPDLKRVNVQSDILALETKLRYNQLFPTLNVFGGYGRNGLDNTLPQSVTFDTNSFTFVTNSAQKATLGNALDDISQNRNPKWNVGALFSIPLSRKNERNRYKAAKESQAQNDAAARLLSQTILQEVDTAIAFAKASYERVGATRQATLFAEMALDAEEKKLQAGTTTQFEVLRLQRDLTTARSGEIRALTDYNRALIEVFFRDGTILDRNKIQVKFR